MRRVVFDTTTVVSALVFTGGRLAWMRNHWRQGQCVPLSSRDTAQELLRVLSYKKFELSHSRSTELLADYLPFCDLIAINTRCRTQCRDSNDQPFLDLAESGRAEALVSGDRDLLALRGRTRFRIETPAEYRARVDA